MPSQDLIEAMLADLMAGLILTGTLDRHPGLRLVMAEAGLTRARRSVILQPIEGESGRKP